MTSDGSTASDERDEGPCPPSCRARKLVDVVRPSRRLTRFLAPLVVLLLAAPACGSDNEPAALEVVGTEMAFAAPDTIAPGDYVVRFSNEGAAFHELAVKNAEGRVLRRVTAGPGQRADMELTLPAGTYELGCFEPGHYEAGMHRMLTVR